MHAGKVVIHAIPSKYFQGDSYTCSYTNASNFLAALTSLLAFYLFHIANCAEV